MSMCMPETDIKGRDKQLHPIDIVGCNYLPLPLIPSSGAHDLVFPQNKSIRRSSTQIRERNQYIFLDLFNEQWLVNYYTISNWIYKSYEVDHIQGWFWTCAQPMKDVVTK